MLRHEQMAKVMTNDALSRPNIFGIEGQEGRIILP